MKKKWTIFALLVALLVTLAACTTTDSKTTPPANDNDQQTTDDQTPDDNDDTDSVDSDEPETPDDTDPEDDDNNVTADGISDLPETELFDYVTQSGSESSKAVDELVDRFTEDPEAFLISMANEGGLDDQVYSGIGARIAELEVAGDTSPKTALDKAKALDNLAEETFAELQLIDQYYSYWMQQF